MTKKTIIFDLVFLGVSILLVIYGYFFRDIQYKNYIDLGIFFILLISILKNFVIIPLNYYYSFFQYLYIY
ncbi:hypothetical protein EV215_0838 [Hypnocyclicus thermotrophus]|uniref:Uncharacterized protein n=1 Tax=Hypnocyclicus thermotrophus TaxID=1627895 RepID=A0AA46DZ47_9FUSO|nr:hypothetical protein EV215_0838 [Hypnocyclicus thermotrophus]